MSKAGIDAYYVPSTDPHQSEYVPDCWQRRRWFSGFTGSAGDLVITHKTAGLWTDGRYFLQAGNELAGSTIKLFKLGNPGVPTIPQWLASTFKPGMVLGADPQVLSCPVHAELQQAVGRAGGKIKLIERNLVDRLWGKDRPPASKTSIEVLSSKLTGATAAQKLGRLRKAMKAYRADAHVLTSLDAIAWLFNIRADDVDHNPVAIANALITNQGAMIFTDLDKVTPATARKLGAKVRFLPYNDLGGELKALAKARKKVWVDSATANMWVTSKLRHSELIVEPSPVYNMKAAKNAVEIQGMRAAHLRDGVAMVKFLAWLPGAVAQGGLTEYSVMEKVDSLRAQQDLFRGTSFGTIAGYQGNGAIIHYEAEEQTAAPLQPRGILLLDSGGQYMDGTTDITRTVLLGGQATPEQKDRYTRVLKGHIDLTLCRFPAGTVGKQLDTVARAPLWERGLNYNHGTGHGVGHFLNVHEGPQAISPTRCTGAPLVEGNILSNEPGYYKEGRYGIRIENLVLVVKDAKYSTEEQPFLRFETLTLCPIDTRLVNVALLTPVQRRWLNSYHSTVRKALSDKLTEAERKWLHQATKRI